MKNEPKHWMTGSSREEYHLSSRNPGAFKNNKSAHLVHYDPHVQDMVRHAPLRAKDLSRFPLPDRLPVDMGLGEAILRRTSGRDFSQVPLRGEQLSTLLYMANAVSPAPGNPHRRNAPNSGNLGSVEVFPIIMNVDGLQPGIYHFDTVAHDLALVQPGNFRTWLRERVFYQIEFPEAAAVFVLTSAIGRLAAKYGQRGYRLGLLDVGHVSENVYLVGTALGLQVCASAGFIDEELDAALGIDGLDMATMLVLMVGRSNER